MTAQAVFFTACKRARELDKARVFLHSGQRAARYFLHSATKLLDTRSVVDMIVWEFSTQDAQPEKEKRPGQMLCPARNLAFSRII